METENQGGSSISCPGDSVWMEVAAGLKPEETCERLLAHAARCSDCARSLGEALRILSPEGSREEDSMIAALKSSQPRWQSQLVSRLAERAGSRYSNRRQRGTWLAAAAVLAAIGVYFYWQNPAPPLHLLAEAYTAH